jgi:hypothetical protein
MQVRVVPAATVNMLIPRTLAQQMVMRLAFRVLGLQPGYGSCQQSLCQLSHLLPV